MSARRLLSLSALVFSTAVCAQTPITLDQAKRLAFQAQIDSQEAMKQAAVNAIAGLARETPSDVVARAYGGETRLFGKDSLIPAPFDPRLILRVAPAVAKAACDTGVAAEPIKDWDGYRDTVRDQVDGFRVPTTMPPPGHGGDLALLLNNWGGTGTGDIDGDGTVGGGDLAALLNNWG